MSDKKYYLTEDGLKKVRNEYKELKKQRKEKLRFEAPEAFHSEDVNSEYLTFQKDLNLLEEKISKLEDVIRSAEIIKMPPKGYKEIRLGAEIVIDVGGHEDKITIVGTLEADPSKGKISNESPVGKALFGHKEGDFVTVPFPTRIVYKIKKITYSNN